MAINRIPWKRRLSTRITIIVFACLITADILSLPLMMWLERLFYPELWEQYEDWQIVDFISIGALSLFNAVFVGLILMWIFPRVFLKRLESIASQARDNRETAIPAEFQSSGKDEISILAQALNEMRLRVKVLVGQLERRDEQRMDWIAQVSHDLRTPLMALTASLDHSTKLIAESQAVNHSELMEENADALGDARRISSLAEDLLDVARLEAPDALNLEQVNPGEVVAQALGTLRPIAKEKGILIQSRLEPNLSNLQADGRLVMRALENVLINSLHHANEQIQISVEMVDDAVRFTVRDDGVGFPGELGAIPYQRLKEKRSRRDSAGLGLLVTQRVAESHAGTLEAYDRPSGGARVCFSIRDVNSIRFGR